MNSTEQTLELLKQVQSAGQLGMLQTDLAKAGITLSTGLVAYDLEPTARLMVPDLTLIPLVRSIPRVGGGIGNAINYKQITQLTPTSLGVAEGKRAGIMGVTSVDRVAVYKRLGQETYVTVDAEESSLPGTDNRALAAIAVLRSLIRRQEPVLLGGNTSLALTKTPTPDVQDVAGGGNFKAKSKYVVNCVALTMEGAVNASVVNGVPTVEVRTNADGTQDNIGGGSAQVSDAASQTTGDDSSDTHSLKASVAWVVGAVAYAWLWGADGGDIKLGAITSINSILLTNCTPGGTQKVSDLPASDNSRNQLICDGLLTQICIPDSGSYQKVLATGTLGTGTPLHSDGAGGIVEFNDAFRSFWDTNKQHLAPDLIYANTEQLEDINNLVVASGGEPMFTFIVDMSNPATAALTAGRRVGYVTNKIAGGPPAELINHPDMPKGCIMFRCSRVDYAFADASNILEVKTIRDYYQIDWPQTTMSYWIGAYMRGALLNRYTPAFGAIFNIAKG